MWRDDPSLPEWRDDPSLPECEMLFDSIAGDLFRQSIWATGLLVGLLAAAFVIDLVLSAVERRLNRRFPDGLAPQLVRGVRRPLVLFVVILGLYLALLALSAQEPWRGSIMNAFNIAMILLVGRTIASLSTTGINWYIRVVAPLTATLVDDKMLPTLRRVVTVTVYAITLLIALDTLGVSISPLLGGLGIGGLAVALAMQPTLGNFFAGTYILSDGAIHIGDYIELHNGPSGYVSEVGWRSTKIRTWLNNLVIIPNSVLADTIVINTRAPDPTVNVMVTCGVSYASDLTEVERVVMEVTQQILDDCPHAAPDEPWFGYDGFGDSNVNFWIFVKARDRLGSFVVTNELIKRIHARFAQEGIEINYPVRKLVYPEEGQVGTGEVKGPPASRA
jgi:small-conductance mechanosensitive channel